MRLRQRRRELLIRSGSRPAQNTHSYNHKMLWATWRQ